MLKAKYNWVWFTQAETKSQENCIMKVDYIKKNLIYIYCIRSIEKLFSLYLENTFTMQPLFILAVC